MLVLQDGKTDKFEQLAEGIIKANAEIININLAKDGIVSNVFPYVTNSQALGHNLLRAEDRKQEAILAKESRKMTLSGPFDLLQGGTGLAFRQPIFLPRSPGEREKTFWGFCIVTYHFLQILTTRVDFGILPPPAFPGRSGARTPPAASDPSCWPPARRWTAQLSGKKPLHCKT
ncbi:CHASE domain-containing protein [uncultured Desulfovibrio sp.]|uniref:CHASE domain-containing protein n=1 Tax=uncultured Desulfovibrio sp. TaxID=167968 RepID=UPI002637F845|nr:CHASE domain-containing protein [uncultured Desulfovibrio sp.]